MTSRQTVWQRKNPDRVKASKIRYFEKLRFDVFNHYSNGVMICSCCGEKHIEFLTINHDEGNGNKHRESIGRKGDSFWRWLRINNYPSGYSVMCYNCNCCLGHRGYCPHKTSASLNK